MKKMLYMCAIEWKWIAQRPHFLEMELENYYDITVLSPVHVLKKMKTQKNTKLPKKFKEFYLLPYQEKVGIISGLSKLLFRSKVRNIGDYDIIWLGSSLFEKYIPADYKGIVVFDYMDDCISMQSDVRMKKAYEISQEKLSKRADLICASSNYLINLLPDYAKEKSILVRNAFRGETRIPPKSASDSDLTRSEQKKIKLGYVGTIAAWMDNNLLLSAQKEHPETEYHFWGPSEIEEISENGFFYHGVVDHGRIPEVVEGMDALMMPFIVNDIVKAVDPVKLYEYISYGKTIISVGYPEVERFGDYVWLYKSEAEFIDLLRKLSEGMLVCKYDSETQKTFLEQNTWAMRAKDVYGALNELTEHRALS